MINGGKWMLLVFVGFMLVSTVLYSKFSINGLLPVSDHHFISSDAKYKESKFESASKKKNAFMARNNEDQKLETILRNASTDDGTVILTNVNDAWVKPHSLFDLFLGSFHIGDDTRKLLKHVVVITFNQEAYVTCKSLHPHCYLLDTRGDNFTGQALFMTSSYLHMVWRKIEVLSNVLEMGYDFVFTDADVMWLRNPFKHFFKDADFQVACDRFEGDSSHISNSANTGFIYARSNSKTIQLFQLWYASRMTYQGLHDQDVFNKIKNHPLLTEIDLKIKFLDTKYLSGFCQVSRDFGKVCTVHANCCVGLENKVHDLKIALEDWKHYKSLSPYDEVKSNCGWRVPQKCKV